MKPYNIEIFDRQFNFLYTALVDEKDFVYKFDAISPEKNTIPLPLSFKPTELSQDTRAPKGWYIRIIRDDEEYQGVITGYEKGDTQGVVTYSQLITLFNNQVIITSRSTINTSIETVIKNCLINDYINNDDSQQNIYGLDANNIVVTSSTTGAMDFSYLDNTENTDVVINLLDDLILKATSLYGIYFTCSLNVKLKKLYVSIGKNLTAEKTIETALPNTIAKNVVIEKTNKEVNKVTIYDSSSSAKVNYYLHSDGTYSTTDSDRILPVINEIYFLDTYEEAKTVLDTSISENQSVINECLEADYRSLYDDEYEALIAATNYLLPMIHNHLVMNAIINSADVDVDTYTSDPVVEIGDKHIYFTAERWSRSQYNILNPTELNIGKERITYYYLASLHGHLEVEGDTEVYVHKTDNTSYTQTVSPSNRVTSSDLSSAISAYKQSADYESDIAEVSETILAEKAVELVKKAFSGNKYNNLIELSFTKNDIMINPMSMEVGQVVNIIHDGVSYNSILTGKEISGGLVKLIFGTIRLELTKILNMKGV